MRALLSFFALIAIPFVTFSAPAIQGQSSDWQRLFYDDFEDGIADGWTLKGLDPNGYWEVYSDNGNYVLKGQGQNWATPTIKYSWSDYSLKCKVKIISGRIHINYRVNDAERYFVAFDPGSITLFKHDWIHPAVSLISHDESFANDRWYNINITGIRNNIKVFVDDQLKIDYTDDKPVKGGSIAFEVNPTSVFYVDNIEVLGEPEPKPPSGYVWQRTGGPNGGTGYDVRIHPTNSRIMFVTDNPSGVNKSTDGGTTWQQKNSGMNADSQRFGNGAPIFTLTVDPNNPNIVWSGTQDLKGIFKSTDGGETWQEMDNGITEGDEISFRGIAIKPGNSRVVLAAAEVRTGKWGYQFSISTGKIYKTIDGGKNWYPVWEGNNLARVLIYDYENPDIVYCSTGIFDREASNTDVSNKIEGGEGILKSTDGGEHWFNINNGLRNLYLGFLEMHPTNPRILYAAAGNPTLFDMGIPGDIYKTIDGGNSWQRIYTDHAYFSVVTVSRSDTNIIYAANDKAFYKSTDAGVSWQKYNNQPQDYGYGPPGISAGIPIGIVVDPNNSETVFINSYQGGNFKTTNGGKSWINSSKGYTGAFMRAITIDPKNPESVYAIAVQGPYKSRDGGFDWEGLAYGPATGPMNWFKLIPNPNDSSTLLMSDESRGRILKSNDGGVSWRTVFTHPVVDGSPNNRHGFKALAYTPSNPNIVYGGMRKTLSGGGLEPLYGKSFGVFKSTDGGETWLEKNSGLESSYESINVIIVHPANQDIAYAGTLLDGIYKTTDGGGNWIRVSNGLSFTDVRSMAIDPVNPEIIYAGSGDGRGVAKSTDGGASWQDTNSGLDIVCPSYLSPIGRTTPGYDLTKPKSIVSSSYLSGFIPWTKIFDIVIDPSDHEKIYAADLNKGIFLSTNGGSVWYSINTGLSIISTVGLAISQDGKILYAATQGGGVHRMALGKNIPPQILTCSPSTLDTVSITSGDSLLFNFTAFDLNNDKLGYTWIFDDVVDANSTGTSFLFRTRNELVGYHDLIACISDGDTAVSVHWKINITAATGIDADQLLGIPSAFSMDQNYPNPFNPSTTINYSVPKTSMVTIKVYDVMGREVAKLVNEEKPPGKYSVRFSADGKVLTSGVYFYRMQAGEFVEIRKFVLLK